MHKRTKLLAFSQNTATAILQRDKGCLFCKMGIYMDGALSIDLAVHDIMHIVNKSQGGLGVLENGVEGCRWHHNHMDNGKYPELREIAEDYLKSLYPGWTKESVTYQKYKDLVVYRK
jgi:hypothetical protein